ncbi:MAG: phage portal protein [Alistipes sp.]|nr:phage portal protein [Alistipes sp.]
MGDWPSVVKSGGGNNNFWRWGDDNMMPEALALMSRRSTIHRRIINDKADYISGKGVNSETGGQPLKNFMERANGDGESLRQVIHKLAFDKSLFGNAFMEVITDQAHSFLSLHHQDASHCRVARDESSIVMHHDWRRFKPAEARRLPLYPAFEVCKDGLMRSVVHYKDYEPMFRHYGVPSYIAGMNVSAIAYKTDRWNISRLDNSFQLSGVMLLEGLVDDDEQAEEILAAAEKKFAGQPGQVMFMITDSLGRDTSRFVPIAADNDGDWKRLHDQATGDIVVAHSWFRSLSGLDYSGGFSSERIMHEYEIALNTVIVPEQNDLLEPIKRVVASVTGLDASGMEVINRPPTRKKALYMKVWEARRDAGLDFDLDDPTQQLYIAQITKYNLESID